MKVQGSSASSSYYNTGSQPHVIPVDVIEMETTDGVTFVPTPLLMLGYRSPDIPGLIVEDRLLPSARMVSAKYEATMRLNFKPKQGDRPCQILSIHL